jgi:hypothetical protein
MQLYSHPSGSPSGYLLRLNVGLNVDAGRAEHKREMHLLHSSIGGFKSVIDAKRDASGRFVRRSQSMARSADPQIPLPAEWWNAIFNPGADPY